jgi:hypothetical protein
MASIEADDAKTVAMVFGSLINIRNMGRRTGPHGLH